jgi:hypothetical protein
MSAGDADAADAKVLARTTDNVNYSTASSASGEVKSPNVSCGDTFLFLSSGLTM